MDEDEVPLNSYTYYIALARIELAIPVWTGCASIQNSEDRPELQ